MDEIDLLYEFDGGFGDEGWGDDGWGDDDSEEVRQRRLAKGEGGPRDQTPAKNAPQRHTSPLLRPPEQSGGLDGHR